MQNNKIVDGIAEALKTMASQKAEKICKKSEKDSRKNKQQNDLNSALEGVAVTLLDAFFNEIRHIAESTTSDGTKHKIEIHDGFAPSKDKSTTNTSAPSESSEKTPNEMTREEILDKLNEAFATKRNDTNKLRELLEKEKTLHAADKAALDATKDALAHSRELEAENERLLAENRELKEKLYDLLKINGKI